MTTNQDQKQVSCIRCQKRKESVLIFIKKNKLHQANVLMIDVFYFSYYQIMLNYKSTVTSSTKKPYDPSNLSHTRVPSSARSPLRSSAHEPAILRTPPRSTSTRFEKLQRARQEIEEVIGEVEGKRERWRDGANEVQGVNEQVLDTFNGLGQQQKRQQYRQYSENQSKKHRHQPKYEEYPQRYHQNRPYAENIQQRTPVRNEYQANPYIYRSSYEPQQFHGRDQLIESFPLTEFRIDQNRRYQPQPVSQFAPIPVEKRLNEEIKRNNGMMARIAQLESQNKNLQARSAYQTPSTQQNSESYELHRENEQLRQRLAELSSQNQLPSYLYDQMEELKAENQQLRQDVKKLLRAKGL